MARPVLAELGAPYAQRELICHLITHHQISFYLLERERPERRAHLISYQTRCDLLAILAAADARGRICPDCARLLDNITLFRELCREENCLAAHSRFLYFRRDRSADYEAFDDWHGQVTLLSGLPGMGKDTWARAHAGDAPVISLDDLRAELDIDPADTQRPVIAAAREQARIHLRVGRPFIWNATNISRQLRGQLIELFADYKAKVNVVYLEARLDEAARRNRARAKTVPEAAFARMLDCWGAARPH